MPSDFFEAVDTIVVRPTAERYELLLTALAPVSHHDPATGRDDTNRVLFNRQKHLLASPPPSSFPDQATINRIAAAHPVPADLAPIVGDLTFAEFVGVVLVRQFLDLYNHGDGVGSFAGLERYERLEARVRLAAVGAPSLRTWWDRVTAWLQVPLHASEADVALLEVLGLPRGLQHATLRALTDGSRSIIAIARAWHTQAKLMHAAYAERAGVEAVTAEPVTLAWSAAIHPDADAQASVVEVPAVSGNSLRHQVVREPGWRHLFQQLGLRETTPGQGPLPPGVEAMFYNGGNIRAGAKQPSDPHRLSLAVRAHFPLLDLVGGVTDSFDLGESCLSVGAWLVCRENQPALAGSPAATLPAAKVSVFDLLDDVTLTRQAGRTGLGQMIYSFETLCAGAQVLLRLMLRPGTPALTRGALYAAIRTFLETTPEIGGQSARGFGHVAGQWIISPPPSAATELAAYEDYLDLHRETLVGVLMDGTLGSGQRIVS